ncbi:MAG: hypothetical protein KDA60_00940 [Planctomycetales bacterium]|nr:hypothetical protein [Planctomycetales bacterium]
MPSGTASQLARNLIERFGDSQEGVEALAAKLDINLRFLPDESHDDFSGSVFVECAESESTPIPNEVLARIANRVQRRMVRAASSNYVRHTFQELENGWSVTPHVLDNTVLRFIEYLKDKGDVREALVFKLFYCDNNTTEEVCRITGIKKSTFYAITRKLQERFKAFSSTIDYES